MILHISNFVDKLDMSRVYISNLIDKLNMNQRICKKVLRTGNEMVDLPDNAMIKFFSRLNYEDWTNLSTTCSSLWFWEDLNICGSRWIFRYMSLKWILQSCLSLDALILRRHHSVIRKSVIVLIDRSWRNEIPKKLEANIAVTLVMIHLNWLHPSTKQLKVFISGQDILERITIYAN